ncbi:ABC transporter permease [Anoxybacterium hadale]|uniref:ABC transporter permease n=1 Tax=Anoxybacterium hadale TaxID=3408580 RepID=UPI003AFFB35C
MIKITKRAELPKRQEYVIRAIAILFSLICAGLVIAILGFNPLAVFQQIVLGALGTELRIQQTIVKAIPLIITSLGILVAFKMKFWNIGGEGQIIMGAFGATLVALNIPETLATPLALTAMAAAAIVCGGIWAFIPAIFKAKFGTNETIFTLMMNYIGIKWVTFLQYGPWKDPASQGFPKIANFTPNAVLPSLFGVHIGWIFALVLVALVYIFINHTKKGFEITVVGESIETARYAGMNINSVIITSMLISGGLCGLTGMIQASAIERTLTATLSGGYGFTAIITTWLGRLSAPIIMVVCISFAILLQGGAYLQIAMAVPAAVADMIQGIILFFVLGSEFFLTYKLSFSGIQSRKKEVA